LVETGKSLRAPLVISTKKGSCPLGHPTPPRGHRRACHTHTEKFQASAPFLPALHVIMDRLGDQEQTDE
jgi:hypothetical protein